MLSNKIHFHTFDALRFFAFLKVFLLHLPVPDNFTFFNYLRGGGGIGVSFFFCLSGFLITYILVTEKLNTGKIDFKLYFFRRALRIWPLYFIIVILVFLLPYNFKTNIGFHIVGGYELDWRYSFTFLENYKMILTDQFPKTTPLNVFWSLCIEEHFYLIWVFLIGFVSVKRLPYLFVLCILVSNLDRLFIEPLYHNSNISTNDILSNLDLFSVSAILGYLAATRFKQLEKAVLFVPNVIKLCYILLVVVIVCAQPFFFIPANKIITSLYNTIIALMFSLLIAIFIPLHSKLRLDEQNIFSKFGKISYGLYVYHLMVIHIILWYCLTHKLKLDYWPNLTLFITLAFGLTILLGTFSYKYIESPFLILRNRLKKGKYLEISAPLK
jgi:peptidoglycan/LPS O-acetylase OafA/YrhL